MIQRGNRRLVGLTEILVTLNLIGVMAVINPLAAGVLTAVVGTVGLVGTAWLGGDAYIKAKTNQQEPK